MFKVVVNPKVPLLWESKVFKMLLLKALNLFDVSTVADCIPLVVITFLDCLFTSLPISDLGVTEFLAI